MLTVNQFYPPNYDVLLAQPVVVYRAHSSGGAPGSQRIFKRFFGGEEKC